MSVLLLAALSVQAQLDESCTVSVLNRTALPSATGAWRVTNLPTGFGSVRARAICAKNGVTTFGATSLQTLTPGVSTAFDQTIALTPAALRIPSTLAMVLDVTRLPARASAARLQVTANYPVGVYDLRRPAAKTA